MTQPPSPKYSSAMASAVPFLLILAMIGGSDGAWCVCNPAASTSGQQTTIDYACGAGANCAPILQNGACYSPNTVNSHCSYAANSYYQNSNQNPQACNFSGVAQLVTTDPSTSGCTYPATASAATGSGGTTPSTSPGTPASSTITPTTGSSTNTPSSTFSPTPTGGTGIGGLGLGPTGTTIDGSGAGLLLPEAKMGPLLLVSALIFLLRIWV